MKARKYFDPEIETMARAGEDEGPALVTLILLQKLFVPVLTGGLDKKSPYLVVIAS